MPGLGRLLLGACTPCCTDTPCHSSALQLGPEALALLERASRLGEPMASLIDTSVSAAARLVRVYGVRVTLAFIHALGYRRVIQESKQPLDSLRN